MTLQELHQTFESRAKDLTGFIYLKTNGDEDMKQEAQEAMWRGLQKDSSATDAYLRTRMRWRTRDVLKKGSSIDTHRVSRTQARVCLLNDSDAEDEVMAECIRDRHFPLDEQVINKVDSERFLNTLDMTERTIVLNKLKGMTDKEVIKDLGMTPERYEYVRDAIRPKIEDYYTSKYKSLSHQRSPRIEFLNAPGTPSSTQFSSCRHVSIIFSFRPHCPIPIVPVEPIISRLFGRPG